MPVTDEALREPVRYEITLKPGYLRADLYNRQTAEETRAFLDEVVGECIKRYLYRVLIFVHTSKPVFTVEKYGFSSFVELAMRYSGKVALLTDSVECRMAQDYVAMLARLRGANVRTFRDDGAAIRWLIDRRESRDRRRQPELRVEPQRRQRERRASARDSVVSRSS